LFVGGGCHPVTAVTRFSKVSHGKGKWGKFCKSGDSGDTVTRM